MAEFTFDSDHLVCLMAALLVAGRFASGDPHAEDEVEQLIEIAEGIYERVCCLDRVTLPDDRK